MPQPTVIDRLTDAFGTCEGITLSAADVQDVMSRLLETEDAVLELLGRYEPEVARIIDMTEKVA